MGVGDLSWMLSFKDYWYAVVSAVIGAAIGIGWTIRQFRAQQCRAADRCLARIRECISFNIDRLNQAKGQLKTKVVPNYPLDTAQLNFWLAQSHDILPADLIRAIDWQRYQLDHISTKFVAVNQLIVSAAGFPASAEYMNALLTSLHQHIEGVLKELPPLLDKIPRHAEPGAAADRGGM